MNTPVLADDQSNLSMKKQLVSELWTEVRRAAEVLSAAKSENESIKQNLAKANAEIERLSTRISELEKMLTSRTGPSTDGFDEKEKTHLVQVARDLIARIDKQLSLF